MGCWNGTCTLTGLPILHGDEVYVFPLVDNIGDSPCYTTSHYKPISLPFEGVYDDYGGAEKCHGPFLDKTIEDLRNILVEQEQGENEFHDIEVKRDQFDINYFFHATHKRRLFVKTYDGEKSVHHALVRKDAATMIWENNKTRVYKYNKFRTPESDYYYTATYQEIFTKGIDKACDTLNEHHSSVLSYEDIQKITDDKEKLRAMRKIIGGDDLEHLYEDADDIDEFFILRSLRLATQVGRMKIRKTASEKGAEREFLRSIMLFCMVDGFMDGVRKIWLPSTHVGSQSECWDEYAMLNQITDMVRNKREDDF